MHPYVHCSIGYNSKGLETTHCPLVDKWLKRHRAFIQWNIPQPQKKKKKKRMKSYQLLQYGWTYRVLCSGK